MYLSKAPKKTDKKSSHQRKPSDSPAQQWLFLYEEMGSSNFKLGSKTTAEMRAMDYSFEVILKLLHLDYSNPIAYKFWIISNSMSTAVPLLNNPSVFVTYELYCKNDPVVTIIVRPAGDPTPNSSQAPSAPNSLRERRKASGQKNLQNVFIRPIRPSETKQLDVVSCDPISDLLEEEKIVLDLGRGRMEVFSISYLLG
ncbi:hypothetical protein VI817_008772 [Penicillium citrinum]|nr:hypothetical protein VI817_008772 [Penicillium citrinum]